ncbi:hypothetical protein AGLY_014182 [Aphis glycines]|uniref:Uncharacterized protein n=1 Tax=Aphis glycines TaxID=307491 RepID=A0A6G0T5M9_APHGL|nr:hypothetical protein AGLY_014182 [Aphis glycines]
MSQLQMLFLFSLVYVNFLGVMNSLTSSSVILLLFVWCSFTIFEIDSINIFFNSPVNIFPELPTIVFSKVDEKKTSNNKNYLINKFIKKYLFIKNLIYNITIKLKTTPEQIHIDYTNHLHSYKQLLQKKLQTLIITKKNDSTLTIDELSDLVFQPNNQQPTNTNSDIQHNRQTYNLENLKKKPTNFYSTDTKLMIYIKKHYVF